MTERALTHEARIRALELVVAGRVPDNPGADVTLKEHFETRINALEQATRIASEAMDHRLDGMNEFRDTLKDQAAKFVTREELDVQLAVNREAIRELRTFKDQQQGKASSQSVYIGYGFSLIAIILGILSLLAK